jgi:hypothetical protein
MKVVNGLIFSSDKVSQISITFLIDIIKLKCDRDI